MDDYDCIVKKSKLSFKGDKRTSKKRHKREKEPNDLALAHCQPGTSGDANRNELKQDAQDHGGWWKVHCYEHIQDDVAIEFLPGCYAKALSNGTIVLGNPHPPGEPPDEEEIFTALPAGTNQVAFKTGFGRYLCVETARKQLMGLSEAIGEPETFLPVFQDAKMALSAHNDCFLSPEELDDEQEHSGVQNIVARANKAGPDQMLSIRINNDPSFAGHNNDSTQLDEGNIYETELGYLKKFQSKGASRQMLCNDDDRRHLKQARIEGQLHEALLDRRTKLKSDKYCK